MEKLSKAIISSWDKRFPDWKIKCPDVEKQLNYFTAEFRKYYSEKEISNNELDNTIFNESLGIFGPSKINLFYQESQLNLQNNITIIDSFKLYASGKELKPKHLIENYFYNIMALSLNG